MPKQVAYAARDAWTAVAVVEILGRERPGVFGAEALMRVVEGERKLWNLEGRAGRRRKAKVEWKVLRNGGVEGEDKDVVAVRRRRKNEAWEVVQDMIPDQLCIFDGKKLGFD